MKPTCHSVALALLAATALGSCRTIQEGSFPVGTSSSQLAISTETPLRIERDEHPMPDGMQPVTLYVGSVEVLVRDDVLQRLGVDPRELQAQLSDNLQTALTRFDHVSGVIDADEVESSLKGRSAPIRVSAALMDVRYAAPRSASQPADSASEGSSSSNERKAAKPGTVECRVRLTFQRRTEDGSLMEFAAPQALGRSKIDAAEPGEKVANLDEELPEAVLLGLFGAMAQALPDFERLYSEEIADAKARRR